MIYHIADKDIWKNLNKDGWYHTETLYKQGFIHCSYLNQLEKVANYNFKGRDNLIILKINEKDLKSRVISEDLYNSNEEFPHIYGPINVDAVSSVYLFEADERGIFRLPDELTSDVLLINGNDLSIEDVYDVAFRNKKVKISKKVRNILLEKRKNLENSIKNKTIYGINTGFGILADKKISFGELDELQENLVLSHAAGVGKPVKKEIVRAVMLIRANSLCKGFSGIRPEVVDQLLLFLNENIIPVVPEKGSVGASGDLAPLAHVALALIGKGEVFYKDRRYKTEEFLKQMEIEPLILKAKEGLSLLNGTAFMAGWGCCSLYIFNELFDISVLIASMSVDALLGSTSPFDERIQQTRSHSGQIYVAKKLRENLKDSEIRSSHLHCDRVQDAYSLRTLPQVYGAVLDTANYLHDILLKEINSSTDNPLIFDNGDVISGGNFHGEPVALGFDFMSIAITDMCNIIERRIDRLVNPKLNDLPPFLTNGKEGLNSGYMIWQYTAAALASENKTLAHPASADTITTSGFQEDHVSMGAWGTRKLWKILMNFVQMLSIEAVLAHRAMEFVKPKKSGKKIEELYCQMSDLLPPHKKDRYFGDEFRSVTEFLFEKAGLEKIDYEN